MNMNNEEEVLGLLTRLLDQLHQADLKNFGSKIEIVYVAPGAQHVEKQINIGALQPLPNPASPLPPLRKARGTLRARGEKEAYPDPPKGREISKIHQAKIVSQEERIRQCISLLMTERYGDEPLFCLQGHWQAVYRILVDKGYCRDSDFDGFDAFIRRVMPEEVNKPYKKDSVRNINKTSFNKPFDRWRYDPNDFGTRKPFERMVAIAQRFKDILERNGL